MSTQILAVEDDPISRKLLTTVLEQAGYNLTVADNGEAAWSLFQKQPHRLVISDWLMPRLDGLELCRRIRALKGAPYTYFILLTANVGQKDHYFQAMESGVDDFLRKPLDRSEMAVRLRVAERIIQATTRMQTMEHMLTLCAYTKKIQIPDEGWETIEDFLQKHFGIQVSHGVSPDYYEKVLRPQIEALKKR